MKKTKLSAVLQLSRPVNVGITVISIFIAAFITGSLHPLYKVLVAAFAGGIITAGANTVNDYYDMEIDRINKPTRPLPNGDLQANAALLISTLEFTAGILLSLFINFTAFAIAFTISLLLFFYSFKLKRLPLWGNLAVSLSTAMAFVYGGVAVNRVRLTLIPAAFAFFYHLGREIIKDVQDMEGDSAYNARTFPLVFGKKEALRLINIVFLLLIVLTAIPYFARWYGGYYFLVVLIGIYPVLIFSMISISKNQSFKNLGLVSNLLKADMLVGLLAIYLG